jgi:hypothetical protein
MHLIIIIIFIITINKNGIYRVMNNLYLMVKIEKIF